MSQYARPSGVNAVSSWYESVGSSQTNIYTAIDETTRSDTDYIYSTPDGVPDTAPCEIALSSIIDPVVHTGHIVRYTYLRTKTNKDLTLVVRLVDSSYGVVASWTHTNPLDTYTLAEQTLTETQAGYITSYSDLALQFEVTVNAGGGGHANVSWAELQTPDGVTNQTVTLANASVTITENQSTLAKGEIAKVLDTATISGTPNSLSIYIPESKVRVHWIELRIPESGDITIVLDPANITITENGLTLVKGEKISSLATGSLSISAQSLTLSLATLIPLDSVSLTLTPQTVTVLKGEIAIPIDYGTVSTTPQALTLAKGEVIIGLDTATVTVTAQSITISKGEVIISFDNALITLEGQILEADSGIPPPTAVELFVAQLTSSAQSLTLVKGAVSVTLNNSSVSANGQALSVLKGEVTTQLDSSSVSANAGAITVGKGEVHLYFDSATLTSVAQAITVVEGEIAIEVSVATLVQQGQSITVDSGAVPPTTVSLNNASLSASPQGTTLEKGEYTATFSVSSITATAQAITLDTPVTIQLNTNAITATPKIIDVATNTVILLGNASLTISGQVISVIVGEYTLSLSGASITITGQAITIKNLTLIAPAGDISLGGWTDEDFGVVNIYTSIDELILDENDYVQSPNLPSTNTYKFKLENATDPEDDTDHTVFYNYSKPSGTETIYINIRLLQGDTVIAEWQDTVYETITYTEHTLTELQASNITDYTDLYIEVEAV